jgi:Flp pilus assembly protein CpaB
VARAVTFELSTEDSLKLVLATNVGRLSLVLRRASETVSAPEQRVTEQDLYPERKATFAAADPTPAPAALAPQATEAVSHQVAVFRDMKQQTYNVPLSSPSRYDLQTAATANLATVTAKNPRPARETFDN